MISEADSSKRDSLTSSIWRRTQGDIAGWEGVGNPDFRCASYDANHWSCDGGICFACVRSSSDESINRDSAIVKIEDDDTCKLVALCGLAGIGYTGPAELEGQPTREWIAVTLAREGCVQPFQAAEALARSATDAIKGIHPDPRRMAFLMVGWDFIVSKEGLRPHY